MGIDYASVMASYINDIKPFHTKIFGINVILRYTDNANANVVEVTRSNITHIVDTQPRFNGYDYPGYDIYPYDVPLFGTSLARMPMLYPEPESHTYQAIADIIPGDVITYPPGYSYGIDTMYVYIDNELVPDGVAQIEPIDYNNISLSDGARTFSTTISSSVYIPAGAVITLSTHAGDIDNMLWSELDNSGFVSHLLDHHGFDLANNDYITGTASTPTNVPGNANNNMAMVHVSEVFSITLI